MFARISHLLGKMVASRDVSLHGDYLASSSDLADLERRMRQIEAADQAVTAEPDRDFRTDGLVHAL